MKSFNFSKKFEQVTSLVLAIMLLLSVFTASNVAVFADSNNKSTKTKNSDSEVNLYVKSYIPGTRHHEVVDSLIIVVRSSYCFRIERGFTVDHPEISSHKGYIDITNIA